MKRDFTVGRLQRQFVQALLRWGLLVTGGARFLAGEVLGMPGGQMNIDRPAQHLPGLVAKVFDLGKGRFPRRAIFTKATPCQQRHQRIELLSLIRREVQVFVSSILSSWQIPF